MNLKPDDDIIYKKKCVQEFEKAILSEKDYKIRTKLIDLLMKILQITNPK